MKKMVFAWLAALCMMSCATSKQNVMKDLDELTDEIVENANEYNFRDWQKKQRSFHRIDKKLQKYTFTEGEQAEIDAQRGVCIGYFTVGVYGESSNKITEARMKLQNIVDGIQKALRP